MAIMDNLTAFSDEQAITTDAPSTNYIDTQVNDVPLGNHEFHPIVITIDETFVGGTSLQVLLNTSDQADFTGGSTRTIAASASIPVADLAVPADKIVLQMPAVEYDRYIRLGYNVTGTFTAGKVSAAVAANADVYKSVPRGYVTA